MSADGARELPRDLERARADLRAFHRDLLRAVQRASGADWRTAGKEGWSPAELLLHVVLVGEEALDGLRTSTRSAPRDPSSLAVRLARRVVLTTWRLPADLLMPPRTHPGGVLLSPEEVSGRGTRLVASLESLLAAAADDPSPRRFAHSRLGAMTVREWARYLRIYLRHHDLRLPGPG